MSEENYAVFDIGERELLSKILLSKEEAEEFYKLSTNENKRIVKFGWFVVEPSQKTENPSGGKKQ